VKIMIDFEDLHEKFHEEAEAPLLFSLSIANY
jgi:hypothetical protein